MDPMCRHLAAACEEGNRALAPVPPPRRSREERLERVVPAPPLLLCAGACADDVGVPLPDLFLLPLLHPPFEAASRLACLDLQPKKCCLVPTWMILAPAEITALREEVRALVPEWAEFDIR